MILRTKPNITNLLRIKNIRCNENIYICMYISNSKKTKHIHKSGEIIKWKCPYSCFWCSLNWTIRSYIFLQFLETKYFYCDFLIKISNNKILCCRFIHVFANEPLLWAIFITLCAANAFIVCFAVKKIKFISLLLTLITCSCTRYMPVYIEMRAHTWVILSATPSYIKGAYVTKNMLGIAGK